MASNGLLRPVNNEEQEMVLNALLNDDSVDLEETLVSNGSESVKRKSMITLTPKTWLNDEIISYYLKVALTTRDDFFCEQDSNRKRNYFYNSYFYDFLDLYVLYVVSFVWCIWFTVVDLLCMVYGGWLIWFMVVGL